MVKNRQEQETPRGQAVAWTMYAMSLKQHCSRARGTGETTARHALRWKKIRSRRSNAVMLKLAMTACAKRLPQSSLPRHGNSKFQHHRLKIKRRNHVKRAFMAAHAATVQRRRQRCRERQSLFCHHCAGKDKRLLFRKKLSHRNAKKQESGIPLGFFYAPFLPRTKRIAVFPQSVSCHRQIRLRRKDTHCVTRLFQNFALRTWASARQSAAADYGLQPSTGA